VETPIPYTSETMARTYVAICNGVRRRGATAAEVASALGAFALIAGAPVCASVLAVPDAAISWWIWPAALFLVCFVLGLLAVPAGIGGGVLFVPLVSGFFPFHLDFIRAAGLLVALTGALSAGPTLLRSGLAHLRLGLPLAVVASASAIAGAMLGLALPTSTVQTALGVTILGIVVLMVRAGRSEQPEVARPDRLSVALGMHGVFVDFATGEAVAWRTHRTPQGLAVFVLIGMMAGMFGLGAGWANVPTLNLLLGAPLKVSAGTSSLVLSLVDSSAVWVYLNRGAVLPIVAVPAMFGMALGARIGARLLVVLPAAKIRRMVIVLLLVAGIRSLLKGLAVWS
jgi:uncharacterized membrane protein YfcA